MAAITATLWKATRFASEAAGLEKTLRLIQALVQIIAYNLPAQEAIPWFHARSQLALGRRYLRFVRFTDAFALARAHVSSTTSGITPLLEMGKYSCLGMYLLLESCTMLDAMGVYKTPWAAWLLLEANRFWFYSLSFSLVLSGLQLWQLLATTSASETAMASEPENKVKVLRSGKAVKVATLEEGIKIRGKERMAKRRAIAKKVMMDVCDLLIPGAMVGWIPVGSVTVGLTTVVGTLLASGDIWGRI